MISILYLTRCDGIKNYGGDITQMRETANAIMNMKSNSIQVDIYDGDYSISALEGIIIRYDIIHFFNTMRYFELNTIFRLCKKYHKPFVLSPIYHNRDSMERLWKYTGMYILNFTFSYYIRNIFQVLKHNCWSLLLQKPIVLKSIIKNSTYLLPNSEKEMEYLLKDLNIEKNKIFYSVIYNGIKKSSVKLTNNNTQYQLENIVRKYKNKYICVGRIAPLKNQLNIIKAFKELEEINNSVIVFIGKKNDKYQNYFEAFKNELTENILYLGYVEFEILMQLYPLFDCVVTSSYFETCNLTLMEGMKYGLQGVCSMEGYSSDYYKEYLYYCDPSNVDSITNTMQKALIDKIDTSSFIDEIETLYSWDNAAKETLFVYSKILEKKELK